jgi:hypothetical protein
MEEYIVYLPYVPPVLTILWGLICLRIYTMISKDNPGQRRLIAVGGAVGAALIYVLASNLAALLQAPSSETTEAKSDEGRVKVQMKAE